MPAAVFALGHVDAAQIVDLLEQHLHWRGPPLDVQRIDHFMASLIDNSVNAKKAIKILRDYQSCDPRPSAHYQGREWSANNAFAIDVRKLNRFCLYALSRFIYSMTAS
ncbi:uncharacterized protein LOC129600353 [Paramacrobiotus metropolitanus]|uniref:uncharacterized protein LOC129600353 n=1 Tax=Paramacrobiotus metropolitanus TaxID=2943436 RepID=UPI0024463A3D|nr:uncharacterized protein LOC129600353 [Paramacrobiotus metropolitanus]